LVIFVLRSFVIYYIAVTIDLGIIKHGWQAVWKKYFKGTRVSIKRKMPKAILITNTLSPNRLRYISVKTGTMSISK